MIPNIANGATIDTLIIISTGGRIPQISEGKSKHEKSTCWIKIGYDQLQIKILISHIVIHYRGLALYYATTEIILIEKYALTIDVKFILRKLCLCVLWKSGTV